MSAHVEHGYYLPQPSRWPVVTALGLTMIMFGIGTTINGLAFGKLLLTAGALTMAYLFFGWFSDVIAENESGVYDAQVDRSFRQGMVWFILSEVFFFLCFFGSLFYIRTFALPWLGGEGQLGSSNLLWEGFVAQWPTDGPAHVAGEYSAMGAAGIPALNTLILLSSGATVTWAHWGLKKENRRQLVLGLVATVTLGLLFVGFQAYEYGHAYAEMNLTLESGIYGATFYMMTGFHGLHVTIGAIMLMAILGRAIKGHSTPHNHFGFEGVAWYWHFVDVVWLGLYFFVYWF
jgi:cytochrome c oxidase subunit 3